MSKGVIRIVLPVLAGIVFIAAWYGVHAALSEDYQFSFPTPGAVITALGENADALTRATINTAEGALLGFLLAVAVSALVAIVLSSSTLIRASVYPYLMILQMMPVIVVAPILVLWVGAGLKSVVIITFLVCFLPLVVNTTQGLISTDRHLLELFESYRATRLQRLLHLQIPAALPQFFTGMRIAATLAPVAALVGDYTAGSSAGDGGGLGFQAVIYSSRAQYAALFATAGVTCVLGFILVSLVVGLSRLALHHWHDSYDRSRN